MYVNILAELLFLTKNYCILRHLNTCKHLLKERTFKGDSFLSSEFMRLLVSLGDDLTDEEVNYIWQRLQNSVESRPMQPEFLFHWMISNKIISVSNVENLSLHFKVLGRTDLLSKTDEYTNKLGIFSLSTLYNLDRTQPDASCGRALIFNNSTFKRQPIKSDERFARKNLSDRKGTHVDAERLKQLWTDFGIQTVVHDDTSCSEFQRLLKECMSNDLSSLKILIICILSHGEDGVIFCSDRVPFSISSIEALLGTCQKLANIPKLLIIQACQGHAVQRKDGAGSLAKTFELDGPAVNQRENEPQPQYSDMLIGTATVPGFMSIRNVKEGTYFIQTFVEVLQEHGDKHDLSMLVREINDKVTRKWATYTHNGEEITLVQMPTFRNQLRKGLIFKRVSREPSISS